MEGGPSELEVLGVAGSLVARLRPPAAWTIRDLKRHLHMAHGAPLFSQQLMLGSTITEDDAVLSSLGHPLRLTLVVLSFDPEAGPMLLRATTHGTQEDVEQALRARADPNYAGECGRTPLHGASQNGHLKLVRHLCEAGADKDRAMHGGATPLHVASERGHLEVVRSLCDAGADKERCLQDGTTPLFLAAQNGHLDVVRFLCEAGAEKDKCRQHGATPLLIATLYDRSDVVRFLCGAGADKGRRLQDGTTPLHAASLNGNEELARFLEEAAASQAGGGQRAAGAVGRVMRRLQCAHRQARADPGQRVLDP